MVPKVMLKQKLCVLLLSCDWLVPDYKCQNFSTKDKLLPPTHQKIKAWTIITNDKVNMRNIFLWGGQVGE